MEICPEIQKLCFRVEANVPVVVKPDPRPAITFGNEYRNLWNLVENIFVLCHNYAHQKFWRFFALVNALTLLTSRSLAPLTCPAGWQVGALQGGGSGLEGGGSATLGSAQ